MKDVESTSSLVREFDVAGIPRLTRSYEKFIMLAKNKDQAPWHIRIFQFYEGKCEKTGKGRCLTETDIMRLCVLHQLPLSIIMWMYSNSGKLGTTTFIFLYFMIMNFMATPIFMLFAFLSMYTSKGFVRLWDMIPLFKGIALAFVIEELTEEVYNINECTCSGVMYCYHILTKETLWSLCKFSFDRSQTVCIPAGSNVIGKTIPSNYSFASKLYMREVIYREWPNDASTGKASWGPISMERLVIQGIVYTLLLFCLFRGLFWFYKYFRFIIFGAVGYLGLTLLCVVIYAESFFTYGRVLHKGLTTLTNPLRWTTTLVLSISRIGPGSIMYITSLLPRHVYPGGFSVRLAFYKVCVVIVCLIFQAHIVIIVLGTYGFPQGKEKEAGIRGKEIIFAGSADALTYLPAYRVFYFLFYASVAIIAFAQTFLTVIGILESILEEKFTYASSRIGVAFFICVTLQVMSFPSTTRGGATGLGYVWFNFGCFIIRPLLLCLALLVVTTVYTVSRVTTDYNFFYRKPIQSVWTAIWQISPIILIICVGVTTFLSVGGLKKTPMLAKVRFIPFLLNAMMIATIIAYIFFLYWRKFRRRRAEKLVVIKPKREWGPPNSRTRRTRARYNPAKEIHFRMKKVNCNHTCLLNKEILQSITYEATQQMHLAVQQMIQETGRGTKFFEIVSDEMLEKACDEYQIEKIEGVVENREDELGKSSAGKCADDCRKAVCTGVTKGEKTEKDSPSSSSSSLRQEVESHSEASFSALEEDTSTDLNL